ncbi:MAG TPA: hypothetical protein DEF34_01700 [Desulfotomaculum sp.]|nr:MAG: hypothetical protein VR67_14935 [Peptococcaceae bacterium BRH_c8a]KJS76393.1 MAG: hypothetical protein JL56_05425 [Desulfotomaculum sp. BICA1-6]HBX22338.1 hypothetical protein [Desulfotomaculum sp.]
MHNYKKVNKFSVKYVRTSNNGWVAIFDEEELQDFAIENLMGIRVLELAEAIKKWQDHEVVGEFYTLAALRYCSKMDRVRRYLGKKGNRFVDQVREKNLIVTHGVTKADWESPMMKNRSLGR